VSIKNFISFVINFHIQYALLIVCLCLVAVYVFSLLCQCFSITWHKYVQFLIILLATCLVNQMGYHIYKLSLGINKECWFGC